jgi:hypothetical protein
MQRITGWLLLVGMLISGGVSLMAQDQTTPPPKVLVVIREFLKPGKAGSAHEKTESAFVAASAAAKWPQHYLAADSLTGQSRSLFFSGYDSFAAWEKDTLDTAKNAAFSAALDRASAADGELLSSIESSAFAFNEELSYHAPIDIAAMRYFEISRYRVRVGHNKDWEAIVKIYRAAYEKAVPDSHWAVYDDVYGHNSGGNHLVIFPMKSLSEVDKSFADSKKIEAAIGEEGLKKVADLEAACIEESEVNVFQFNPRESYAPDSWVKSDPSFWKSKAAAPAKKAEPKPAQ